MTDINIPPEVVEAAAIDLHHSIWGQDGYSWADIDDEIREAFRNHARASIHAAIMAWPGMEHRTGYNMLRYIILPIPQENSND